MNTTAEKLERLAELHAARDVMAMLKQDEIARVLTPEIKAALDGIEAEFSPKFDAVDGNIATLEAEIKQEVIAAGATVRSTYFMAVWNKGRAGGWDSSKLDGFAMAHPEILAAKIPDGKPTCTLRKVG